MNQVQVNLCISTWASKEHASVTFVCAHISSRPPNSYDVSSGSTNKRNR